MILGPVCGVIFLAIVMACIALWRAKRKKARNTAAGVGIPISTITTSASHTAQPGMVEDLPQPAGSPYLDPRLPDPRSPAVSSSNTNPEEAPPPYPG